MTEPRGQAAVTLPSTKVQQYEFNGVGSSNSSRGSSPLSKSDSIPSSQLPPLRRNIPPSQLPPSRNAVANITQKVSQLNVSNPENTSSVVVNSMNKPRTSTPIQFEQQYKADRSMENVPLINEQYNPEIINKNVTVSNSNNMNLLTNKTDLSDNQSEQNPVNHSLSQYFNQSSRSTNNTPPNKPIEEQRAVTPQSQGQGNVPQKAAVPAYTGFPAVHNIQPHTFDRQKNMAVQNLGQYNTTPPSESVQPPPPPYSAYPPQINLKSNPNQMPNKIVSQPQQVTRQPSHMKHPQMSQNYPRIHPPTAFSTEPISNVHPGFQHQQQPAQLESNAFNNRSYNTNVPPPPPPPPNVTYPNNPNLGITNVNQSNYGPPYMVKQPMVTSTGAPQINQQNFGMPPVSQPNYGAPPPPPASAAQQSYGVPHANQGNFRNPPTNLAAPPPPPTNQANIRNPSNLGVQASGTIQPPLTGPIQNQPNTTTTTTTINRYPTLLQQPSATIDKPNQYQPTSGVVHSGFNKYFGLNNQDLLQLPNILPPEKLEPLSYILGNERLDQINCSPDIFRCTMTKIPETSSLLQKSRLPLGLLIHPFKDLAYLPVIQCNIIVRCRGCRTYINPFVTFLDSKRWKCNLCYRPNELPEEFQYDPISKTYGDPSRRPEVKSSTIEYIAPAEYMLRPPQPAVYLFLLDVSRFALESGYLEIFCKVLLEELTKLPGDGRTQVGFIAFNSALHVFSLVDGANQPHEMVILDIDDVFLPAPENLLVNLKDGIEMIVDLLKLLPQRFNKSFDGNSALGAALQFGYKLLSMSGGRITVFQAALPNIGPGSVIVREDPNQRAAVDVVHLNPANDFYKRLALECSGQQIAVDLFVVNAQYVDMATISGISKFSGGCVYHFPLFKSTNLQMVDSFQKSLRRYFTRKIGFEAVMRVRCTRGLAIQTFHGNFFVRSTDLLSLPNINPDAGFGMQVAIEESLNGCQTVCFQAALLYTSSKGERRIRVHTLCLPVVATLDEVIYSADQQCIVGLLGKMAVDRSTQSSLSDAREAFINAAIDILSSYKLLINLGSNSPGLFAPDCLKLLPLYISAILKHPAFRIGIATKLDDRVKAMLDMKTKPLHILMQQIYPDLYPIHNLDSLQMILNNEEEPIYVPPRLQLSSRCLDSKGAYLMDCGDFIIIYICPAVSRDFLQQVIGVSSYTSISDNAWDIPNLDNQYNRGLHNFINYLCDEKSFYVPLQVIRDNSPNRIIFLEKLVDDRLENSLSYHEFLQHIKSQVK